MRLWSIHPQYLDRAGLLAAWREALLAQNVLLGNTKGYRNHPQLERFKDTSRPVAAVGAYLTGLFDEATRRGYSFNHSKIVEPGPSAIRIEVTQGQLDYEIAWLYAKLEMRSPSTLEHPAWQALQPALGVTSALEFANLAPRTHPLFDVVPGPRASWEKGPKLT